MATFAKSYGRAYEWLEEAREGFGPVILTCALNGGVQGQEALEAIPETPAEIATQAREAYDAGAAVVHVHARDPKDRANSTSDPRVFSEINSAIRSKCPDLIINNSTGGGPTVTMAERLEGLSARPELASLNMGPDMSRFVVKPRPMPLKHPHDGFAYDECIAFTYGIIERLAAKMIELDIKPELETYHGGQFWVTARLLELGLLKPPYMHQFVMGYQTSALGTPDNLCSLVRELPNGSIYGVCGIGPLQLPMTTMSVLMGGHARVGLEDNLYYSRGRKFRGNGEPVERAVRICRELNREVASPQQARTILGLTPTPRNYPGEAVLAEWA